MHPCRFIAGLATLASCLVLTAPSFAAELTAEQLADILDDGGDGVCLVFDGVDVCSGVLLDRKGLIATSCRLGLSPLTLRAAVRVSRGKKVEIVEQLECACRRAGGRARLGSGGRAGGRHPLSDSLEGACDRRHPLRTLART